MNWLMGDRAGQATIAVWDWLWGKEVANPQPSPEETLAVAERALELMMQSVANLCAAVNQQASSYTKLQLLYDTKTQELANLERSAALAAKAGREREARMKLVQVIQQEQLLAQLNTQVDRAEALLISSQNRLTQEQLEIERYRTEIQNTKDLARVNIALREIARVNDGANDSSAKATLENAQMQATEYEMQQKILADITQNRSELMTENSDLELQNRVNERLAKLKENNSEIPLN